MLIWRLFTLAILLILSGFFSGVEVALISLSTFKIKHLLKHKKRGSKSLGKLKKNPQRMIITILVGNNIVNIWASVLATLIATDLFGANGAGIAVGTMTFLVLVFGEITPKTFAATHAEKIALMVAKPLLILQRIILPIVILFELISKLVLKLFAKPNQQPLITEEYLKTMIEVGAKEKAIEKNEHEFMKNILDFNDIPVKDVMTKRHNMVCLDANMTVAKTIPFMAESPFSRIPLFLGSLDKIVGIVHVKNILEAINDNTKNMKLRHIAVKPFFVHENMLLDDLFKELQDKHTHLAIVVGKQGQVVGLVTLEDLLEELVGEIFDETDMMPGVIMRLDKNTILVDGETEISYVNDFFNVKMPHNKEIITIHDFILEQLGSMPARGAHFKYQNVSFLIEEIGERDVERVKMIKK